MGLKLISQKLPDSNFSPVRYSSFPLPPARTGTLEDFNKLRLCCPVTVPRYVLQSPNLLLAHAVLALNLTHSIIKVALLEYCRVEKETQDAPVRTLNQPGCLNMHFPLSLHITVPLLSYVALLLKYTHLADLMLPHQEQRDKEVHRIT